MPPVEIKKFDALIYNKLFFIQPVENRQEEYEKLQMSKNNEFLMENLLNYSYQQNYYKIIGIDLLRQTSTSMKWILQEKYKKILVQIFFITEKSKKLFLAFL